MDFEADFKCVLIAKWMKNLFQMSICVGLGFEMGFCSQNQGAKRSREQQNRSKHSDCCSNIDFAHFRTYRKVWPSLGSNLVPNSIIFGPKFDAKSTSETDFIYWSCFSLQSLPKWCQKRSQNAWSELIKSTLGHLWPDQAGFLVSKTPPQRLK